MAAMFHYYLLLPHLPFLRNSLPLTFPRSAATDELSVLHQTVHNCCHCALGCSANWMYSQYTQGQDCHSDGPTLEKRTSWQQPFETEDGQMQSPAPGVDILPALVQCSDGLTGFQVSWKGSRCSGGSRQNESAACSGSKGGQQHPMLYNWEVMSLGSDRSPCI